MPAELVEAGADLLRGVVLLCRCLGLCPVVDLVIVLLVELGWLALLLFGLLLGLCRWLVVALGVPLDELGEPAVQLVECVLDLGLDPCDEVGARALVLACGSSFECVELVGLFVGCRAGCRPVL